jgi:ABC-type Fe3+/spermidine/putrescine transport system ATPase subunit
MRSSGLSLEVVGLAKRYGATAALKPVDLAVNPGEFLTLLGPSGSGKTTLLNLVAGHLEPTEGRVIIGKADMTGVPARRRNIGMVFQNYALFPHLSVGENVGYGLMVRRRPPAEIRRRTAAALDLVQLTGLEARSVRHLSGGQQQRVALARALIIEPDILLMDEPLGALDRQLRRMVQLELRRLHDHHGRTTVYVTHDQEEALVLSDRIAVFRDGRLEQAASPADIYRRPVNTFVASFVGESNILPATIKQIRDGLAVAEVPALGREIVAEAGPTCTAGNGACLLVRPEHFVLDDAGVPASVEESVYLGELVALRLRLEAGERIWLRRIADREIKAGAKVRIGWQVEHLRLIPNT